MCQQPVSKYIHLLKLDIQCRASAICAYCFGKNYETMNGEPRKLKQEAILVFRTPAEHYLQETQSVKCIK